VSLQPRAHVINHGTALGGRDTVKVLLALLDREAAAPPARNKADLLCEALLGGGDDDTGAPMLTLFRCGSYSPRLSWDYRLVTSQLGTPTEMYADYISLPVGPVHWVGR